ncbi:HPt (histidine-containing phosphotransfer) domain-containing protein [Methylobacterium sp. BE186]|uniref:Hpt domain-containing protein n=1 Tax=Methylobacterium sp. BE186 TaxID=2817715 RepID=UPI002860E2FC|nr:Hpt domain-containing protein [Methylobacterium sp. BE186]MDR7036193.1 HPt (histidine-containing phosphotransfer) domain-containing protein [Methylobacterium sp. BE186]
MQDEPAIDRAHLDAQTFGDKPLAAELLGLFAGQCRALLPGIVNAKVSAGERADRAHTLKGSALGVGAAAVAASAARVEEDLRRGGASGMADLEALERAVAAALAEIDRPRAM